MKVKRHNNNSFGNKYINLDELIKGSRIIHKILMYIYIIKKIIIDRNNYSKLNSINTFCLFLGYMRSGHSFVGTLLNAHPNMAIAHEYQWPVKQTEFLSRNQFLRRFFLKQINRIFMYEIFLDSANRKGNWFEQFGYKYTANFKSANEYSQSEILVLGDKSGGLFTKSLIPTMNKDSNLLDVFRDFYRRNYTLKFLHIIRNPFDMISTQFLRNNFTDIFGEQANIETLYETYIQEKSLHKMKISLSTEINLYANYFENIQTIKDSGKWDILDIRYEDLIQDMNSNIRTILTFFNLDCPEGYVEYCSSQIKSSLNSRYFIKGFWTDEQIETVNSLLLKYDFLRGYQLV